MHQCPVVLCLSQIERVIEVRARSVDVTKHSYYDLLYCFHTSRGNHRKGEWLQLLQGENGFKRESCKQAIFFPRFGTRHEGFMHVQLNGYVKFSPIVPTQILLCPLPPSIVSSWLLWPEWCQKKVWNICVGFVYSLNTSSGQTFNTACHRHLDCSLQCSL